MPRRARALIGGMVYHVLNRAAGRRTLFHCDADYDAFERVLVEAHERTPLRILAYCVMPNHFHLVVWPRQSHDHEVSEFMRWLTLTHAQRYHAHFKSAGTGPVYQGRFKSFPTQSDPHLHTLIRYVERNPKRAGLVRSAADWRWSSLWRWVHGDELANVLLSDWPITSGARPRDWVSIVNRAESEKELQALRLCASRGRPLGDDRWLRHTVARLGLEQSMRPRGRPPRE